MFAKPLAYIEMVLLGVRHMMVLIKRSIGTFIVGPCRQWRFARRRQIVSKPSACFLHGYLTLHVTFIGECIEPFRPPVLAFTLELQLVSVSGKQRYATHQLGRGVLKCSNLSDRWSVMAHGVNLVCIEFELPNPAPRFGITCTSNIFCRQLTSGIYGAHLGFEEP